MTAYTCRRAPVRASLSTVVAEESIMTFAFVHSFTRSSHCLFVIVGVMSALTACASVPTGSGAYMVTVIDANSRKPVEGVTLLASGAGTAARGAKPFTAMTDEDGIAVLGFGNWGTVDLVVAANESTERWIVIQNRIAVNGGLSKVEPLRLIVGSAGQGGQSQYELSITRVAKGGKIDN